MDREKGGSDPEFHKKYYAWYLAAQQANNV